MKHLRILAAFAAAVVMGSCAVEKTSNPLSPVVAGPIPGVQISAPKPLEPNTGWLIPGDQQPVTLLIENAYSTGQRPLDYTFEVATDAGFTNKVFSRGAIQPGDANRTALKLPDPLGTGRTYYWRANAQDGANIGPFSAPVSFDVFTPVSFDRPTPISPMNNERTSTVRPEFRFGNAPRTGTPGPVTYVLEVAATDTFATKVVAWQFSESPNETRFTSVSDLPVNTQLFWHVRAFDATAIGPWSDIEVFRTPAPVVAAPPTTPSPSGGACSGSQPVQIVECRRKQFSSHMSSSETLTFERAVASDLNKLGVSGGPFGVLQKSGGASCGGYACDIICAGQGTSQRQWDILIDSGGAQNPTWNGPSTYPNIRADQCDVP